MLQELAGHGLKISALMWADDESEDVVKKQYQAVVSRNTKPHEKPWRITFYDPLDVQKVVHIPMDDEYEYREWEYLEDEVVKAIGDYINDHIFMITGIDHMFLNV